MVGRGHIGDATSLTCGDIELPISMFFLSHSLKSHGLDRFAVELNLTSCVFGPTALSSPVFLRVSGGSETIALVGPLRAVWSASSERGSQ